MFIERRCLFPSVPFISFIYLLYLGHLISRYYTPLPPSGMASWLNSEHRNPRWTYTKQQPNHRLTKTKTLSSSSGGDSEFVSLTRSWPGWCCRSKICTLNSKAINQGQVKPPRIAVAIFKTGKRKLRQVLKSLVKMTMAMA